MKLSGWGKYPVISNGAANQAEEIAAIVKKGKPSPAATACIR